jgi:hypothetical protein
MNNFLLATVKLDPKETWVLRALQGETQGTVSDVLRLALVELANKYHIQKPIITPPIVRRKRANDRAEY